MTRDEFWVIIEEAKRSVENISDIPGWLEDRLSQLPQAEIIDFGSHFSQCSRSAYDARLWLAAVVMLRGCGDDSFAYFRGWLIAQGRKTFEAALADPDSLADADVKDLDGDFRLEKMLYVDTAAYCKSVGKDRHDLETIEKYGELQPPWVPPVLQQRDLLRTSDEDALKLFPRLAARFPKRTYTSPFT